MLECSVDGRSAGVGAIGKSARYARCMSIGFIDIADSCGTPARLAHAGRGMP